MRRFGATLVWLIALAMVCSVAAQAEHFGDVNEYSEELERVLMQKLTLLEALVQSPDMTREVEVANGTNRYVSMADVERMDEAWVRAEGINDLIRPHLTNACARMLVSFQEQHESFVEIFVTDARGLLVCATNKTSDYYQGDESWWRRTAGGHSSYGHIEYDESARAEAIPLYVPIKSSQSQQYIGVAKGVIDITAIMMEL